MQDTFAKLAEDRKALIGRIEADQARWAAQEKAGRNDSILRVCVCVLVVVVLACVL